MHHMRAYQLQQRDEPQMSAVVSCKDADFQQKGEGDMMTHIGRRLAVGDATLGKIEGQGGLGMPGRHTQSGLGAF